MGIGPTIFDFNFRFHNKGGHEVSFEATNQDTTDSATQFFGFISSFGSWLIMRFSISGSTIVYEYIAGQTRADYDNYWHTSTKRYQSPASPLTYVTFDKIGDYLA